MVLSTALAFFTLASAPIAQEADPWEELAAIFDDAVELWVADVGRSRASGSSDPQPPHPSIELWPDFARLAAAGEGRAVVWMLLNLDGAFGADRRAAEIAKIFELVRAGGTAPWVAEAVLPLVERRDSLADAELERHLEQLAAPGGPREVRVAALVGRAALIEEDDQDAARDLRLRAVVLELEDRELGADEMISAAAADALGEAVVGERRAASRAWFERSLKPTEDGVYFHAADAGPDPDLLYRPMLDALAGCGSMNALLWVLGNTSTRRADERERLREHLAVFAAEGAEAEGVEKLRYEMRSLVRQLGADFVESQVRILIERVRDEVRPGLLVGLGTALCEYADEDAKQRARGLALLAEVGERWPGSEEAADAAGQRFRFEKLVVGRVVPDFEAEDVDGTPFRLSDYRGKVTVLDFWGFW